VQFAPHPYEIRLFFLCPWFVSFAAHYAIKGAAPNRDRSKDRMTILFCNTGSLSAQAAFALRVAGRSNVVVMQTG
jgi:rhodanese-related sulfurtransferase